MAGTRFTIPRLYKVPGRSIYVAGLSHRVEQRICPFLVTQTTLFRLSMKL